MTSPAAAGKQEAEKANKSYCKRIDHKNKRRDERRREKHRQSHGGKAERASLHAGFLCLSFFFLQVEGFIRETIYYRRKKFVSFAFHIRNHLRLFDSVDTI